MKKIATAAVLAGVLVFGGAASCQDNAPAEAPEVEVFEFEDCDAEDWKNYDSECGRRSPRPMLTARQPAPKTPAVRETPGAPVSTKKRR